MTRINDIKVSANFKLSEFECTHPQHKHVQLCGELAEKLQRLRSALGKPIIINSGYRCPERNAQVKGSPTSQHLHGKAVDIAVRGVSPKRVAAEAEKIGFGGIGIYETFTHLDTRNGKARW